MKRGPDDTEFEKVPHLKKQKNSEVTKPVDLEQDFQQWMSKQWFSEHSYAKIIWAAKKGHAKIVALLLTDPRVNPAVCKNLAVRHAAENGHAEVIRLLLADDRVNPADDDNIAIGLAAKNGYAEIVRLLLNDDRVDPAADQNFALRMAAGNGHAAIVEKLLTYPKVDPAVLDDIPIRMAAYNGHAAVVRLLLTDPRVKPAAKDNDALTVAVGNGHAAVVELLLINTKVDLPYLNGVMYNAAQNGHAAVVELLLTNTKVEPAVHKNIAIRKAAQNGHAAVVKLLLSFKREGSVAVDPAAENNEALHKAAYNGHAVVVKLLLESKKVNPDVLKMLAVHAYIPFSTRLEDVLAVLLQYPGQTAVLEKINPVMADRMREYYSDAIAVIDGLVKLGLNIELINEIIAEFNPATKGFKTEYAGDNRLITRCFNMKRMQSDIKLVQSNSMDVENAESKPTITKPKDNKKDNRTAIL